MHPDTECTLVELGFTKAQQMCKAIRAALDKPDLPVSFVAESLASMAERCEQSQPFVPGIRRELHDQFCKLDDFYGNIKNYKTAPLPMRILRSIR